MAKQPFSTSEWIFFVGAVLGAGVAVTVFAFDSFEAKGASAEVERALRRDQHRLERKVDSILLRMAIPIKEPTPGAYEEE